MQWIKEADVFVAEASTPSLGVGYEIAVAELLGRGFSVFSNRKKGKKIVLHDRWK